MKGKITKDILLRVGQGVMRIPRDQEGESHEERTPYSPSPRRTQRSKKHSAINKQDQR